MNDLPDPHFLALLQVHRLLDANTVAQLRATQAQWAVQGRAVSLFQLAAHHRLLPPHVLQGLLQASGQAPAQQPPVQQPPAQPGPEQGEVPSDPDTKPPARRSAASRLGAGRSNQRNKPVGRRASQRMAPQRSGSLLPLYLGTVMIGGLVAVLGWRVLAPAPEQVAVEPTAKAGGPASAASTTELDDSGADSNPDTSAEGSEGDDRPGEQPEADDPPQADDPSPEPEPARDPEVAAALKRADETYDAVWEVLQAGKGEEGEAMMLASLGELERLAPDSPQRGKLLFKLADLYWRLSRDPECKRVFGEGLEVFANNPDREVAELARSVALNQFQAGYLKLGLEYLQPVVEVCAPVFNRYEVSALHTERFNALIRLGDFQRARSALEDAKRIGLTDERTDEARRTRYHVLRAEAEFYHRTGLAELAGQAYAKAWKWVDYAWPEGGMARLHENTQYAGVLLQLGQLDRARELLDEARVRLEGLPPGSERDGALSSVHTMLGGVETAAGNHQRAFGFYRQCLAHRREVGRVSAQLLSNTANSAAETGRYEEAVALWCEGLSLVDPSLPTPSVATMHLNLGRALCDMKRVDEGLESMLRAQLVEMDALDRLVRSLTPAERLQALQDQALLIGYWITLAGPARPRDPGYVYGGVYRLGGYVDRASAVLRHGLRRDPGYRGRVLRLAQADAALGDLVYSQPPDPKQHAAWKRAVDQARATRDRLSVELTAKAGRWAPGQQRLRSSVEDLRAQLKPGEVLVHYVRWFDRYVAFVVKPNAKVLGVILERAEVVEAACARFHALAKEAPESREAAAALGRAGSELHALIWKRLQDAVGEATFVYVVPDGPLATVPFAALPGKRPGSVLYEDHPLGFLAHPQDLLPWPDAPPPGVGALAVGGVDYDRAATKTPEGLLEVPEPRRITLQEAMHKAPAGMQFGPLQGTLPEARACLTYYHEATKQDEIYLLQGPFATEAHLRRYAPGRRLLHLSTHGFVRLDLAEVTQGGARLDPLLLTGLALAGCNRTEGGGGDDGILTAHEAAQLNLGGVELVILSACQTAQGSARAGEAVIGLTSAFREAGATSVVSSLWPVSDQATVMLMERFYRLVLVEGVPPPVALQQASLALRAFEVEHEGKKVRPFAAPCYWAAFVSYGPFR